MQKVTHMQFNSSLHITYILFQTIINYEEKEANERLPEDDSECFLATCNNIRAAMAKIVKLKSSGDPNVCNKACTNDYYLLFIVELSVNLIIQIFYRRKMRFVNYKFKHLWRL